MPIAITIAATGEVDGLARALRARGVLRKKGVPMLTKEELPPCPVATCFQLFGNKWKIYIIQQLEVRPFGFNELRRAIPGISQKVLSSNLKEMEAAGLINREVIPETPVRTEYSLSEVGRSLMPIIESMVEWGSNYQTMVNEA